MLLTASLLRTTESYIKKLRGAGIATVSDLLEHYPRTYRDKTDILEYLSLMDIRAPATVRVRIEAVTTEMTRNKKQLTKVVVSDRGGYRCEAVWWGRNYLLSQYRVGDEVILYGKPKYEYGKLSFSGAEIEHASVGASIAPVYPERDYIPSEWFEKKIPLLKPYIETIPDILPEEIRLAKGYQRHRDNLVRIHFPQSVAEWEQARTELAYEELFRLQYEGISRRSALRLASVGRALPIPLDPELVRTIIADLPFSLTDGQKIVLYQTLRDMEGIYAMRRLLQGDVGTGKTVVALVAAIHAIRRSGVQAAIMAPTEILSRQHFEGMQELLSRYGITSDLLVGSLTKKQKDAVKARIASGSVDIVVGTHALLEESVRFHRLGFVVIDEQHRFGVEQRAVLEEALTHGDICPHVLSMTATPIPRTLTLILYGDQDISVLRAYPVGRLPIHTSIVWPDQREEVYRFVGSQIAAGRQVYWISPLVEESDTLDIASATSMTETLRGIFPGVSVGLLHGRMPARDKNSAIDAFIAGEIAILSSTSVVEVGMDNKNATVMVIESAERFGLSQLHQFRGRVGRGSYQSYCYLMTDGDSTDRLRAMERTGDGFELSEMDLELRGPGEVYGVRQSGLPDMRIADVRDMDLVSEIREDILAWEQAKGKGAT